VAELAERRSGASGRAIERWLPLALVLLALAEFWRESWALPAQTDDAYISYRYARNLVEGLGLVYNAGEYVEGMTNLLWTLLVAAGLALGFEAKVVGHALGVASGSAVLWLTYVYARSGLERSQAWVAGLAPWLVLSFVSFACWATSGMETPLFAALCTATLAAHARKRPGWTALAAFLASVTRPEGVLVAGVVFGFLVLETWRERRWRALLWPAVYGLLMLGVTAFRLAYFGSPVPNTFFAKVGGVPPLRGLYYTQGFLVAGVWLLLFPTLIAVARDARWRPAAVTAAVFAAYVVGVGGDAFPHARFFVPVLPALAVMALRGAALAFAGSRVAGGMAWACLAIVLGVNYFGLYTWGIGACILALALAWAVAAAWVRRRPAPAATLALLLAAALQAVEVYPSLEGKGVGLPGRRTRAASLAQIRAYNERMERLAERRTQLVVERDEREALVATGGIGAFGFHAGVPILDLFGLVDPEIARSHSARPTLAAPGHLRSNVEYVFARKPDYILIPRRGAKMIKAPSFVEVWAHPDLDAHYEWDDEIVGYRRRPDS
jgi:hypothetical protein